MYYWEYEIITFIINQGMQRYFIVKIYMLVKISDLSLPGYQGNQPTSVLPYFKQILSLPLTFKSFLINS